MRNKPIILIVDDTQAGQDTLEALLFLDDYQLLFAANGQDALDQAARFAPDLILLDIMMPGMDGFEVCRRLRANIHSSDIPIVMVTALDDRDSRLDGIQAGADDFITKPFDRAELRARIHTITRLNRYRHILAERTRFDKLIELSPDGILISTLQGSIKLANPTALHLLQVEKEIDLLDLQFFSFLAVDQVKYCIGILEELAAGTQNRVYFETYFKQNDGSYLPVDIHAGITQWDDQPHIQIIVRDISTRKKAEENLQRAINDLEQALDETIEGWARALELRDQEAEDHTRRVTEMTMHLCEIMGVHESELVHIRRGAILHDIGKIGIPDAILLKETSLREEERYLMQKHPQYAYKMLSAIFFLRPAAIIPLCHHERWDGTGYPSGLAGEQIPLAARIFSVVDVFDALTSDRPYHAAWSKERALEYIRSQTGKHFDPAVVKAFLMDPETIDRIRLTSV
jgi:PAS domain S-box-containing protein